MCYLGPLLGLCSGALLKGPSLQQAHNKVRSLHFPGRFLSSCVREAVSSIQTGTFSQEQVPMACLTRVVRPTEATLPCSSPIICRQRPRRVLSLGEQGAWPSPILSQEKWRCGSMSKHRWCTPEWMMHPRTSPTVTGNDSGLALPVTLPRNPSAVRPAEGVENSHLCLYV